MTIIKKTTTKKKLILKPQLLKKITKIQSIKAKSWNAMGDENCKGELENSKSRNSRGPAHPQKLQKRYVSKNQ